MILLTGATGNIGRELVSQLAQAKAQFGVLARNPVKAQMMMGQVPGIRIVQGDIAQTKTLRAAMEGVDRLFLLTPSDYRQVGLQRNVIRAAAEAGVKHVVKLSVVGAALNAPAQLMRWHAQNEREIEQSGMSWTHIRPHVFYQYWLQLIYPINLTGGFYASLKEHVPLPAVDIRDIAAVSVRCLTEPGHEGKIYSLTGPEALTNGQVAQMIGKVLKRPLTYTYSTPEATKAGMMQLGMQPWFVDFVVGMDEAYSTGMYGEVTYDVYKLLGRPPISAEQFFADFTDFIRNPPQFDMSMFAQGGTPVNPEELKAKVIRLYDELNHNNFDVLQEIMDPHFTAHGETMGLDPNDKDHLAAVARGIQWAKWMFPDLYVSVDDLVAEGDKVAARLTWRGTVSQDFMGIPASHKTIEWTGMAINRFENGKIVERWFNSDELGMMRGMGMLPTPDGAAPAPADEGSASAPAASASGAQTTMAVEAPVNVSADPQLERNKAIVRRFYNNVFNQVHTDELKDIMVDEFTDHGEALFGSPHGRDTLAGGIAGFRGRFPEAGVELVDMIAEGDMVGVLGEMHLKHDAPWLTAEATGKMLRWRGLSMFRINAEGKITDRYFNSDSLYILEQLGYWPVKS